MSAPPDRNNTNAPLWNYERLKNLKWTEKDLEMYHQFLVRQYLLENDQQRGLLVFFGVGWGKTRVGAMNIREHVEKRQIVVIAPKKVFATFDREFEQVGVSRSNVHKISLKANNLSEQIDRLPGGPGADELKRAPLDNTFIVIDEAHNLFNAIVNGSKNAVYLYDTIMAAKNIKLLLLSATPITNHPFELVPCFNMLAGIKLFPETLEEFEKFFIAKKPDAQDHIKNADRFKNRIFGLVSYYGDWVQAVARANRPKRLPTKVIEVPMGEAQFAVYAGYRDKERAETGSMGQKRDVRFSPKMGSSTYRIRSRQASNFVPNTSKDRGISDPALCPKFYEARRIIDRHAREPGIVCSNFVNECGLLDFAEVLKLDGWVEWDGEDNTPAKRYALVTGESDEENVTRLQKVASSEENKHGEIVRVVLLGPAGAEGIEFKNFRYDIILDPFFNAVRLDQFEGRIDRYQSHEALTPARRTVQPYHLLATYPEKANPSEVKKEPTTDNYLYTTSKRRKLLSLEFYRTMVEASIDCPIHRDKLPHERANKIHCMMCAPTGHPLFTAHLDRDCKAPNPCHAPRVEKIDAREIIIDTVHGEKKFMYTRDKKQGPINFFEYREDLGGYIAVPRNHKEYDLLMDALK